MNINFEQFDPLNRKSKSTIINEQRKRMPSGDMLQKIMRMMSQGKKKRRGPQQQQQPQGAERSTMPDGMDDLGGLMGMMQGQQKPGQMPPEMDMWDAFSGKKQKFMTKNAEEGKPGLESSRDINGNIMKGYMDAAASMRISQPSGGNDPTKFNVPHGSGSDPRMVRGLSPEDLPLQMDYKQLDQIKKPSLEAGMKDPQVAAPHQTPGAPVDIPDGMGGTDQQKSQAMKGAAFFGGKPEMPEPQQGQGGGDMGSMMQQMMGGGMPQGGMPKMDGGGEMPPELMQMMQQMMGGDKKGKQPTKKQPSDMMSMMGQALGGEKPQGMPQMPQMGDDDKKGKQPSGDILQQLMSNPEIKKLLQKLMQGIGG